MAIEKLSDEKPPEESIDSSSGAPKVNIERGHIPKDLGTMHANDLIKKAAGLVAPMNLGGEYLGSFVVHIFEKKSPFSNYQQTFFLCQLLGKEKVIEPQASAAVSELAKQMMMAYGRNIPETRS